MSDVDSIWKKESGEWKKMGIPAKQCPFPVGGIYISVGNTDPSTYWSGTTWSKLSDGTMLMADSTGNKTAVDQELPKHTHGLGSNGQANIGFEGSNLLLRMQSKWINPKTNTTQQFQAGTAGVSKYDYNYSMDYVTTLGGTTENSTTISSGKVIPSGTIKVVMWERLS